MYLKGILREVSTTGAFIMYSSQIAVYTIYFALVTLFISKFQLPMYVLLRVLFLKLFQECSIF